MKAGSSQLIGTLFGFAALVITFWSGFTRVGLGAGGLTTTGAAMARATADFVTPLAAVGLAALSTDGVDLTTSRGACTTSVMRAGVKAGAVDNVVAEAAIASGAGPPSAALGTSRGRAVAAGAADVILATAVALANAGAACTFELSTADTI